MAIELLNIVEIQTDSRYTPVELYYGDITNIGFPVDLLITSSFIGGYGTSLNSVIAALYRNLSIDIKELSKNKTIDFKDALNCWFTNKYNSDLFKWIMVVEITNLNNNENEVIDLEVIFKKMFIAINTLDQLGYEIKTIALPILGAGLQKLNFDNVINTLLKELKINLPKNKTLERILFVENAYDKATLLSNSLDHVLGRANIDIPVDNIMVDIKEEILNLIEVNSSSNLRKTKSFEFLKKTFRNKNARSIEYGIACRRITESIITEKYFNNETYNELSFFNKITELSKLNVANWIISYIHVIRIFGNESAHDTKLKIRIPKNIVSKDITLLLFCVLRIVEFWVNDNK